MVPTWKDLRGVFNRICSIRLLRVNIGLGRQDDAMVCVYCDHHCISLLDQICVSCRVHKIVLQYGDIDEVLHR